MPQTIKFPQIWFSLLVEAYFKGPFYKLKFHNFKADSTPAHHQLWRLVIVLFGFSVFLFLFFSEPWGTAL